MSQRDRLRKAREKLNEVLFYAGGDPVDYIIKDVGFEWQPFMEGTGDRIKALDTGDEDVSIFFYESTDKEVDFPPHFHKYNSEIPSVLKGKITFNTPDSSITLTKGDSIILEKGKHHSAKLEPYTRIIIVYNPGFQGENWNANKSETI